MVTFAPLGTGSFVVSTGRSRGVSITPLKPESTRNGVAMPLTNPKPIVFYLTVLPAFFDLTVVGPLSYLAMIGVMGAMFVLFAFVYVGLAHRARDWLKAKGIKRWADLITAVIMASVAVLLLVR